MDTTETYINQSDCPEIQEQWTIPLRVGQVMDEQIKQILKDHPEIIDYILTPDWVFTSFRLNAYMAFEVRKSELYLEVTE